MLSIATLNTLSAAQKLDTIWDETEKRFMHHYNMPSYSTGEARAARSTGRREYGHGALVEKALQSVIPSVEDFPYAIRVVSEVLSSNGSTSQGSICGTTLALMDAGVPLKAPLPASAAALSRTATTSPRSSTFRASRTSTARWTSRSPVRRKASPPSRWI